MGFSVKTKIKEKKKLRHEELGSSRRQRSHLLYDPKRLPVITERRQLQSRQVKRTP